jgi:hypothetical protein
VADEWDEGLVSGFWFGIQLARSMGFTYYASGFEITTSSAVFWVGRAC